MALRRAERWPLRSRKMDVIENVLSDGRDTDAKLEAELASDREAVVSEIYWEQKKMGELLSTPEGRRARCSVLRN